MKRGSSIAPTTARLTEPTSVTTHSGPRGRQHVADHRRRATCTGAATNAKSASATAASTVSHASSDGTAGDRRLARSRRRVVAADVRAEALAGGQADRAADQPDTDDGDLHAAALRTLPATAAARSTCSR